jgi:hypothetical protein
VTSRKYHRFETFKATTATVYSNIMQNSVTHTTHYVHHWLGNQPSDAAVVMEHGAASLLLYFER